MSRLYDTLVIGTGLGGLNAGLALQRSGYSVLMLEAGKQFGGMINPFARRGYEFDVGMHYVGECGEGQFLRRILNRLGLGEIEFREIDPECFDRYLFDGYEARIPKGPDRWFETLAADFPHEARAIWRFARLLKDTDRLVELGLGKRSVGAFLPLLRAPLEFASLFRVSYGQVLDRYFRDPLLKGVFGAATGVLGMAPGRASAVLSMVGLMHYLKGSYYPVGGGGRVRDAYVGALRGGGAELRRNHAVTRIRKLPDGTFVTVAADGEEFRSRSVVSNADATVTLEMVEGATPNRATLRAARKVRPSLSGLGVYLVTDLDLEAAGFTDGNVWHYGSPDLDALYAAVGAGRAPERPFFFMSSSTLKDPSSRRDGRHTLEMMTWIPGDGYAPWFGTSTRRRGPEYEERKAAAADALLRDAELVIPGLRDHVVLQDSSTPATFASYVRTPHGGVFGPENTPEWSPFRRFGSTTGIPGLFLAGASVGGPGIFACTLSGLSAASRCRSFLSSEPRSTASGVRAAAAAPAPVAG